MGNVATDIAAESRERANATEEERPEPLRERREGERTGRGVYPARSSGRSSRMIGEVVVDLGFADRDTVEEAVRVAREQGRPTGEVLVAQGVLRPDQLARVVAERFGLDYVDLSVYDLDMGAVHLIGADAAKRYRAVPVGFAEDGALLLAMADPTNVLTIDDVAMITGRRVRVGVASVEDLDLLLARLAGIDESIEDIVDGDAEAEAAAELDAGTLAEEADRDAPVIKLVHSIIAQAVQQGASDIHISPEEGDAKVLFRIDGVLSSAATIKRRMIPGVVSRIKIMGDLDIAEKRMPQDGRFALTIEGRRVDIRVVTLPLVYGESVVLRILDKGVTVQSLQSLGMEPAELQRFERAIAKPNGAVLVTGPTGSGKSTTLYGALSVLNDGERSILTIEDPVEQRMAGVKQMQIAPKAGVTFDVGLRSMLRADPDVIMVGEIRDRETAHIAVEAALTGHLVLSTLHTRDAPSALGRLMDMGIEPFLISSAIDCVVAQRLVRMLCSHCKRPQQLSEAVLAEHGLTGAQPLEAVGCSRCGGSGYRGRVGVYEVMAVDERIRTLVLEHGSVDEIAAAAEESGMARLREDGMLKVRAGQTSIAEIERMTSSLLS
ncbi:MAG TPA: ATPase, T2SS/T4P/T4SS family [Solirubrobacteraceae bacterium]|jgi:type IV pilus assembly protein PilB|nr:ATPase, T2SS/T4P/T4SS family [Solirubrobacteraceae bacterium]